MPPFIRLALVAALTVIATPVAAQGVRGIIVTRDTVPVRGAVVSLIDSLDAVGASTLSDEFGRFDLRAPRRGTWRLRTEAVGFARVTSFPVTLASGEQLARTVHLTDATAALRAVDVRGRQQCDVRPAEGTQVATLWDEARKSLAAAQLSADRAPPVAIDQDEIEFDETFLRVRSASRVTTTGRAERGWRSDAPRALRQLGYARRIDSTSIYYAPDARVLLSDDFAASHCFRLVPEDPTSIRRVGLAFSPVGQLEGKLDVTGTIWLDRETFALDRVEFRYDPLLSADFPDTTFGGRVRFARLPTGDLVVTHWVLRMPIFAEADDGRLARAGQTSTMLVRPERRERVVGVKVARGAMRAFDAPPEPLPVVNAAPRRSTGAPSCAEVAPVAGNSGALLGDVRDARDRAVGGARVRATWHQPIVTGGRQAFREQWAEAGADAQGRFALCALPRGLSISVTARNASGSSSPRTRLVLDATGAPPVLALELAAAPRRAAVAEAPAPGAVRGRLVREDGRPVVGAEIRVFPGTERLRTDTAGHFTLPPGPAGTREFFVRRLGFVPLMASVDVSPGDTASIVVSLAQSVQSLAPVTIEAKVTSLNVAGFALRKAAGAGGGTFIGPEEIRAREASTLQSLLRTFTRVRVEESAHTGDVLAYGRAGMSPGQMLNNDCPMRLLVDGSPIPASSFTALPPLREIEAIEVYVSIGAVPPQYSFAQPECGLIVVWTRTGAAP